MVIVLGSTDPEHKNSSGTGPKRTLEYLSPSWCSWEGHLGSPMPSLCVELPSVT